MAFENGILYQQKLSYLFLQDIKSLRLIHVHVSFTNKNNSG